MQATTMTAATLPVDTPKTLTGMHRSRARRTRRGETFTRQPRLKAEAGIACCAMYEVDRKDRVVEVDDAPQSSVGAPLPIVVAAEGQLLLAYLAEVRDPDWDGTTVRVVDAQSEEPVVRVVFDRPKAHMFGPPNDEAFPGHPLASRGLHPYGVFRVERSSWIRKLERMNRVHPHHSSESFDQLAHFVFAFHDSTFECVARSYSAEVVAGPLASAVTGMARTAAADL